MKNIAKPFIANSDQGGSCAADQVKEYESDMAYKTLLIKSKQNENNAILASKDIEIQRLRSELDYLRECHDKLWTMFFHECGLKLEKEFKGYKE